MALPILPQIMLPRTTKVVTRLTQSPRSLVVGNRHLPQCHVLINGLFVVLVLVAKWLGLWLIIVVWDELLLALELLHFVIILDRFVLVEGRAWAAGNTIGIHGAPHERTWTQEVEGWHLPVDLLKGSAFSHGRG